MNTTPPPTSVGCPTSVVLPTPHCPTLFRPQQYARLSIALMPQDVCPCATTKDQRVPGMSSVMPRRALVAVATGACASAPYWGLPHPKRAPLALSASVWNWPTEIVVKLYAVEFRTSVGRKVCEAEPPPSMPSDASPWHQICPRSVSAQSCM